jgi:uroporphyrinogen-III synthase
VRLLVTRAREDGERTAAALRARGHAALLAPLLHIEFLTPVLPAGPFAAVLTTSANGARAVAEHPRVEELHSLPLLTVGTRSAEAARTAGFKKVMSADGDAKDLAALVEWRFAQSAAALLYLAGEDRAADLSGALARHGFTVHTGIVYRAVAADRFPQEAAQALSARQIDGVLHYSARTAAAFVRCIAHAGLQQESARLMHFCLSEQVAAPLRAAGAQTVKIAARPEEPALLELI